MELKIQEYLESFPVVAILGSRQCGKTTLSRMTCPDWNYFDLENSDDRDFVTQDYTFFFKKYPDTTIIDEAQASPDIFKELRGVIDQKRNQYGRFILTDSSSPHLKNSVSESLAGRVGIIELGTLKMNERYERAHPDIYRILDRFSPSEHLEHLQELKPSLNVNQVMHHFLHGGYPEPVTRDQPYFERWMSNYHKTYIERDIRSLFPNLNMENYRRFISMLSDLSGTIVNRSEVGRSLNVGESSIRNYLDIAEGTYIWRSLPSLEKTASKSMVKMAKGYLRDSGLLFHLLRIRDIERLYRYPGVGAAFEGFICEEIIQGLSAIENIPWGTNYYRTRNGAEVDLILTSPDGARIPVEIKFGMSTRRADLRSLSRFIEQEDCPYGILVNNNEEVTMLTENIIQIPAGCL
ncbi:AAA family ATPase [Pontiellaceae bacterium B12227]|nr:AAA family ATPase [Pontiellaceae bacterium B12227]